jgi:hypothetical protein
MNIAIIKNENLANRLLDSKNSLVLLTVGIMSMLFTPVSIDCWMLLTALFVD